MAIAWTGRLRRTGRMRRTDRLCRTGRLYRAGRLCRTGRWCKVALAPVRWGYDAKTRGGLPIGLCWSVK